MGTVPTMRIKLEDGKEVLINKSDYHLYEDKLYKSKSKSKTKSKSSASEE